MSNSYDKDILALCEQGKKIEAIKLFKEATGKGLKESKEYVENLAADHGIIIPRGKGNCFIATSCYGDYDAYEVIVLRIYRDEKLMKTITGRLVVKAYYNLSPFLAHKIDKSKKLKDLTRKYFLRPIVNWISAKI